MRSLNIYGRFSFLPGLPSEVRLTHPDHHLHSTFDRHPSCSLHHPCKTTTVSIISISTILAVFLHSMATPPTATVPLPPPAPPTPEDTWLASTSTAVIYQGLRVIAAAAPAPWVVDKVVYTYRDKRAKQQTLARIAEADIDTYMLCDTIADLADRLIGPDFYRISLITSPHRNFHDIQQASADDEDEWHAAAYVRIRKDCFSRLSSRRWETRRWTSSPSWGSIPKAHL